MGYNTLSLQISDLLSLLQTVSSKNEALKNRVRSVVQLAATTIGSLMESYGSHDASRGQVLGKDISDARFLDDEDLLEEDSEMKTETA
jgi:hypothetical protein